MDRTKTVPPFVIFGTPDFVGLAQRLVKLSFPSATITTVTNQDDEELPDFTSGPPPFAIVGDFRGVHDDVSLVAQIRETYPRAYICRVTKYPDTVIEEEGERLLNSGEYQISNEIKPSGTADLRNLLALKASMLSAPTDGTKHPDPSTPPRGLILFVVPESQKNDPLFRNISERFPQATLTVWGPDFSRWRPESSLLPKNELAEFNAFVGLPITVFVPSSVDGAQRGADEICRLLLDSYLAPWVKTGKAIVTRIDNGDRYHTAPKGVSWINLGKEALSVAVKNIILKLLPD